MTDFTSYVNIKQGTCSEESFSCGNTLPLVATPFGMNHFSLQTKASGNGWYYHPSHKQIEGIRLTHQPSPWVRDYGNFVFMPQSGEPVILEEERSSEFEEICMHPAFIEVYLNRYHARMNLTVSERCAVAQVCWETKETPRFTVMPFGIPARIELHPEAAELSGIINAYGDGTRRDFMMYFYMKFDKVIDVSKTVITKNTGEITPGIAGSGAGVGINIAFDMAEGEMLTVKMGTSFISADLAKLNVMREVEDKTYDAIKQETTEKWNDLLSKIVITDTEEKKKTFYSCFYRCFLFPRIFYEYDEGGKPIHYSTKSGLICEGVMYTDNGFWDTYRTLYPLFSLLIPDRMKEMLEGYLHFYREEGWLPKWLSPGERGIMPGTLVDAVFADAAVKGLFAETQMTLALEGMLKHAGTPGRNKLNGRIGVADYVKKGYIPSDKYKESVNNALDAYYCDYCISRVAELLNKQDIKEEFERRSSNYRILYDESVGFIRGLKEDGTRTESFSPIAWGGEYCEGAAWQNAFGVYHDVDGLAALYGGKDNFAKKLDELFEAPAVFEVGTYGKEIHEMLELSMTGFGQCAISNQPSFHIPYLYSAIGYQEKTAYWVNRMVKEAFSSDEKGFPGDEDNGSMSAWYIFSVLGFYPLCPGKAEYITGVCNAKEIKMALGNGRKVTIKNELYDAADYQGIQVWVDGIQTPEPKISHETLLNAEEMMFGFAGHCDYAECAY